MGPIQQQPVENATRFLLSSRIRCLTIDREREAEGSSDGYVCVCQFFLCSFVFFFFGGEGGCGGDGAGGWGGRREEQDDRGSERQTEIFVSLLKQTHDHL